MSKTMKGKIVSTKMDKTVVVEVTRLKEHPKYGRRFRVTRRYKVHDPENQLKGKDGEEVVIEETRPQSREKRWRIKTPAQS
ncbi:MAG: 30S ribosomal protein S17 [Candidatus Spechtbacteria bacterium]|nr:30S ribosomal protein S17 [Candidatus Spechtbacteria bacterium]